MRKIGTLVTLIAAASGSLVVGCGNNNNPSDTTIDDAVALSFSLQGDGTVLELNGSPVDASHKATYPLGGLKKMNVKVTASGDLTATCEDANGATACQEMPFFAKVQKLDNGQNNVQVYDIYGNKVVDHDCHKPALDGGTATTTPPSSGGSCSNGYGGSTHAGDGGSCQTGSNGGGSGSTSGGNSDAGGGYTTGGGSGSGGSGSGGSGSGGSGSGGAGSGGGSGSGGGMGGGAGSGGSGSCGVDVKADCGGCSITVGTQQCDCSDAHCVKDAISACTGSSGGGYTTSGGGDDNGGGGDNGGGYTTSGGGGGNGGGSGSNGGGGYTTSGGDDAGAGSGGGYTTSGTCDQAAIDAAKNQFCADIDTWLKQHNITTPIDCSKVVDVHYTVANPPAKHDDYHCRDIIATGWAKVRATLATCDADQYVNWESSSRWELLQQGDCRGSPLVLDLDGDGVNLSALESGVSFDLLGSGQKVQTAWTRGGDALLALDWNKNGAIDDASELFGTATFKSDHEDGFRALSELDANGDGRIDSKDPAFAELVVWNDSDRNGVSRPLELTALRDAGVRAIDVDAAHTAGPGSWDSNGNDVSLVGRFVRDDGRAGTVVDAWLRFKPVQ